MQVLENEERKKGGVMIGKINRGGNLEIKRNDKYIRQSCPFLSGGFCGDWCPHFGEPEKKHLCLSKEDRDTYFQIRICHGIVLYFDGFEDKRQTKED